MEGQDNAIAVDESETEQMIRVVMPSEGDMELVEQKGGLLLLKPFYFSGECAGPIVQFVERTGADIKVKTAYRLRIRNGELRLLKAD